MDPVLLQLGVGGVLVIQILQIVIPAIRKRNGNGDPQRDLAEGIARIEATVARLESRLNDSDRR